MELTEAMRTTGTCRYFRHDPVPDEVLRTARSTSPASARRAATASRCAGSSCATPPASRRSPTSTCRCGRPTSTAIADGTVNVGALPKTVTDADYFAEHLAEVPAIVVVCAEVDGLHPTDTELGRLSRRRRRVDLPDRCRTSASRCASRASPPR